MGQDQGCYDHEVGSGLAAEEALLTMTVHTIRWGGAMCVVPQHQSRQPANQSVACRDHQSHSIVLREQGHPLSFGRDLRHVNLR